MTAISVGGVEIKTPVFLAPLAGYTDKAFRALCHEYGCGLSYTEMVSAKSVVYGNARVSTLVDASESARPFAVQLFGSEPAFISEAVKRLEGFPFDIVDINMGCPVPKIVKNGEGCALMREPRLAGRIIEAAAQASAKPVTVKLRKGISGGESAAFLARVAEDSGASAIAVHGRTREQFYSGNADLECIAEAKRAVRVPVIGNGDVTSGESAARMFSQTGCDAVMVARGALGSPWVFSQIISFIESGVEIEPPTWAKRAEIAARHLRDAALQKGERTGLLEMRKHLSFYAKGHPRASELRRKINETESAVEILEMLFTVFAREGGPGAADGHAAI
ncbi:MAG: tRNA dihydrouridine synthase DusB [Defluviitaleaceae bacterium]|nr:tRNA dihydrouridine synthase DusB [Defluviitaleaceae bacterium]